MAFEELEILLNQMEREIESAEQYIKCALEIKDKTMADVYCQMARTEYGHMLSLHTYAKKRIDALISMQEEDAIICQKVYKYFHGKMLDKCARVRSLLALYND